VKVFCSDGKREGQNVNGCPLKCDLEAQILDYSRFGEQTGENGAELKGNFRQGKDE
jgi:hypothetical protein